MKKLLVISLLFSCLLTSLSAQRRINPAKQIYLAPDSSMVLLSDVNGELQFHYLTDVLPPPFSADQDTVTLLPDGRYVLIDEGQRDTIDTRADFSQITTTITVDGQVFNAGDVVQDILIALSRKKSTGCNITVAQTAHAFSVGDLVSQDTNGVYFLATSAVADSFPVAMVCNVIDPNTFQTSVSGRIAWTHGLSLYRDYWLLADGSVGQIPGANPVFAFRTVKSDSVDIDIPENVFVGQAGSAGDADFFKVGTTDPPGDIGDHIFTNGRIGLNIAVPTQAFHLSGRILFDSYSLHDISSNANVMDFSLWDGSSAYQRVFQIGRNGSDEYWLSVTPPASGGGLRIFDNGDFVFENNIGNIWWKNSGNFLLSRIYQNAGDQLHIYGYKGIYFDAGSDLISGDAVFVLQNIPNYADDAAADADANLPAGSIYQVAGDRSLRIKP
ncbi:MAG: hypothetical protein R2824_15875 [Saprospiraceae bacterium]